MRARTILGTILLATAVLPEPPSVAREPAVKTGEVALHAAREGCAVDLDSAAAGKTDAQGNLTISDIEPGDHYVHVRCAGQDESASLISVQVGKKAVIDTTKDEAPAPSADEIPGLRAAEAKIRLRTLVQQAAQARAQGRFDEATSLLREAIQLDPGNSDLHCELGITFLLDKEWKAARVEMLEAMHHDPTNAEAHNGLGYTLEKLGDLPGALKEYRLATHLEPDDPNYRTHYFDLLSKLSQQKTARK